MCVFTFRLWLVSLAILSPLQRITCMTFNQDASYYINRAPTITISCDLVSPSEIGYTYIQENSRHHPTDDHIFVSDKLRIANTAGSWIVR